MMSKLYTFKILACSIEHSFLQLCSTGHMQMNLHRCLLKYTIVPVEGSFKDGPQRSLPPGIDTLVLFPPTFC